MNSTESSLVQRERDTVLSWARKISASIDETKSEQSSTLRPWKDGDVREYGWSNLSELSEQLNDGWGRLQDMQEIALACAVAAYKLRHRNENSGKLVHQSEFRDRNRSQVPDYIYAF